MPGPGSVMKSRVLVIDDEAAIRDSLRMILEYEDYQFVGAASGQEALDVVRRERPDIVLLDIKMPGMDGMEVLRKLRALDEGLPVVMISGHGNTATAVEAIRSGAIDFLDKPLSSERVIVTLRNVLRQSELSTENRDLKVAMESKYELVGPESGAAQCARGRDPCGADQCHGAAARGERCRQGAGRANDPSEQPAQRDSDSSR